MPNPPPPPEPPKARKPYWAPKLRYLGSTRDLTLGTATQGGLDSKGTAGRKGV